MSRFDNIRHEPFTNQQYHSQPAMSVSNSRLRVFKENPRKFYLQYVTGELPKDVSGAMETGSAFHELALETSLVTRETCLDMTLAVFHPSAPPERAPDVDNDFERIWLFDDHVIRESNVWGELDDGRIWDLVETESVGVSAYRPMVRDGEAFTAIPDSVLNKDGHKKGKNYEAFKKHNSGVLMSGKQWREIVGMREEVYSHSKARELLFEGQGVTEYSIVGTDVQYGFEVRCRIDRARHHDGAVYISDVKTSRDATPRKFEKQAINDGLHLQAFIMSELAAELFNAEIWYRYVVVDKTPPYRCEVFELEKELFEAAEVEYDRLLAELKVCFETGNWRPRTHGHINTIHTPTWMMDHKISWK